MKSEYAFTLPRGLVDSAGTVHREGTMRLATARDEIEPLRSVGGRQNEADLTVLLLARTVTRIGEFTEITPDLVEGLFAADFDHLQRLYERITPHAEAVGGGASGSGPTSTTSNVSTSGSTPTEKRWGWWRARPARASSRSTSPR